MEPAGVFAIDRRLQILEVLDLLAQVVEQHVGHIHRETAAHHDAPRRTILSLNVIDAIDVNSSSA
jgi:hypothetical protein